MKSLLSVVGAALLGTVLSSTTVVAAEQVLLQFSYNLDSDIAYQTKLTKIEQSRSNVKSVFVRSAGAYCNISVTNLIYKLDGSEELKVAKKISNSEFLIAEGALSAVNVYFHQNYYDDVSCRLTVSANIEEGEETPEYSLVGAVRYNGGFSRNTSLPLEVVSEVKRIKIETPSFCPNVQVLNIGTVVNNVFYQAQLLQGSKDVYVVHQMGQADVSAIQLSMNGPLDSNCDIPVYVSAN